MEKIDVTALGELLIDFTENGVSEHIFISYQTAALMNNCSS